MCMKSVLALSVLSASTLLSGLVHADSESNFLVGLEGGYARMKTNFITGFLAPTITPLPIISSIDNQTYMISDESLFVGLLAGWQWRCNRMMWGIEGNADFSTLAKAKPFMFSVFAQDAAGIAVVGGPSDVFSATALYERGPVFALTGRVGYFVTSSFMPYVRLGAQVSRDEASYQVFGGTRQTLIEGSSNQLSDFISSGKEDIWGGVAGIGVEFPALFGPSTIRVEYTFNRTESIVIEDGAAPITGTDKFRNPQTNAIKFAWVWNFL